MPFPHFVQILILAPIPLSSTVRPHTSGFTSRTPIYFFFRFSPHIDTLASYSHTHPYPHYATFITYNLFLPQEQLPTLALHLLYTLRIPTLILFSPQIPTPHTFLPPHQHMAHKLPLTPLTTLGPHFLPTPESLQHPYRNAHTNKRSIRHRESEMKGQGE